MIDEPRTGPRAVAILTFDGAQSLDVMPTDYRRRFRTEPTRQAS